MFGKQIMMGVTKFGQNKTMASSTSNIGPGLPAGVSHKTSAQTTWQKSQPDAGPYMLLLLLTQSQSSSAYCKLTCFTKHIQTHARKILKQIHARLSQRFGELLGIKVVFKQGNLAPGSVLEDPISHFLLVRQCTLHVAYKMRTKLRLARYEDAKIHCLHPEPTRRYNNKTQLARFQIKLPVELLDAEAAVACVRR